MFGAGHHAAPVVPSGDASGGGRRPAVIPEHVQVSKTATRADQERK